MNQPTTVVPLPHSMQMPRPTGYGLTHRGCVRSANEDAILSDPAGILWAVADGMGGHEGGAMAADLVIDTLATISDDSPPVEALKQAITTANQRVRTAAVEMGGQTMGATVVALFIQAGIAHVAWAGDSRAYLMRGQRLRMLSHDHSLVQDMVDRGELSRDAAEAHPEAHVITRAVGADDRIEVAHSAVPLIIGDRLLLCSDGLPRCVYESVIAQLTAEGPDAKTTAQSLMYRALDEGAPDNVSVIIVDLVAG
ncbi:protein phosphatase 2C domain-containing protein [Xinfangfangia sp. CPCC 101601]|uniref:Protein phosphatase 2C domain-containing protein n=1 Tax=Pseudogemmobacter lacusdianii TaxID=3069608 RepID=A0ABU0VVE3_9RHOB|nr:protein phosphatase 2C domain-containing protein [Xinfangfangia sp. CPCC 101601]MDQ2065704.1 protein phosphatase 2C domain-containing protein [Xinfangfangia sp. CPCC 101601]